MGDTVSGIGTWLQNNPDVAMKVGGQAAPLFGLSGVGRAMTAAGGATEIGMYGQRNKQYQDDVAKAKLEGKEFAGKAPNDPSTVTENTLKTMNTIPSSRPKPPAPPNAPPSPSHLTWSPGTPAAGRLQGQNTGGVSPLQTSQPGGMEQLAMMLLQQQRGLGSLGGMS